MLGYYVENYELYFSASNCTEFDRYLYKNNYRKKNKEGWLTNDPYKSGN